MQAINAEKIKKNQIFNSIFSDFHNNKARYRAQNQVDGDYDRLGAG
jgi:hypothetical protein